MSTSETITKTDLKNILEAAGNIGSVDSTPTPTASKVSEFDAAAQMNSTDMTSQEVTSFVEDLNIEGGGSGASTPTANTAAKFDANAHMNSADMTSQDIDDFVETLDYTFSILDKFYPVGSYYETSDASFSPSVAWGGTWVLLPQHEVITDVVSTKTLAANSDTEVCTVTLDADTIYIILGAAGTGSATSMTSNCDLSVKSGTTKAWLKFVTNAVTASAGSMLHAAAYIHTDTSCVVSLNKYNYTSSAISTGNGRLAAIPLVGIDETSYRWHRTA